MEGLAIMSSAFGQTGLQPAIRGKIGDLLDYPVASARVVLSGAKLAEKLHAMTGMEGSFMFSRIPPGVYTLEIICSGFSKLVQRGIAVHDHAITGLDLKMDFLEDSRALKLRALSLEYVNDMPMADDCEAPSHLERQLQEVMDELHLDRALFNPPAAVKVGRRANIELGVYQNLREEIMRRLLERKISRFDGDQIEAVLQAELQVSGSLVLPKSLPQVGISGAGYVEWQWEILPRISGLGLIRLSLQTRVKFAGHGERKQCLLVLDRELRIKKNIWLEMRQFLVKGKLVGETHWIS
jgi:hypothetical protein